MSRIEEIKEKFKGRSLDENEVEYLLSLLEIAEKTLKVAVKHIDGKAEKFSEREKIPVLYQLNEALQQLRK